MRTKPGRHAFWLSLLLCPGIAAAQAKTPAPSARPAKAPAAREVPAAKGSLPQAGTKPEASGAPPAAPQKGVPDVTRGAGARKVAAAAENRAPDAPKRETVSVPVGKPEPQQKGRPPAKPAPTLPAERTPTTSDEAVRSRIALGPTDDELRRGKDDPDLRNLSEAERVLFPRPLEGVELGFSFFPLPTANGPELNASGLPSGTVSGEAAGPVPPPGEAAWLHSLVKPNLPLRYDDRVVRYLRFYRDTPNGRAIARAWAKKAGRFGPSLRAELARAGLPTDLVWLSLIESSHNPTIASPVGAAGLWQFMPDAGRSYGLTVDRWVDERLDPERSTAAAIRYLSDLHRRFGSWDLAMAAYNMGYGGLSRAIRKFNSNSFWELARYEAGIPWETTLYVPKILATAVLMNNRRAFGVDAISEDPQERFDTVVVGPAVRLADVARVVGVPAASIQGLNPQYLAGRTPPSAPGAPRSSYRIRVPEGSGHKWQAAPAPLADGLEAYVVRRGETVELIARSRGTSERELRENNRVAADETLAPGTVLLVPARRDHAESEPTSAQEVVVVPERSVDYPGRKRVFYRVVSGDTTSGVATAFKLTPRDIADWNSLDLEARLEPNMSLQVFVPSDADLSNVLHIPEAHAKVLTAGSPEFCDHFEGQNGKKRLMIAARGGDSLTAIGKRYGMSAGQMERVNRRGRTDQLTLGERVVVYTERERPAPGDDLFGTN